MFYGWNFYSIKIKLDFHPESGELSAVRIIPIITTTTMGVEEMAFVTLTSADS